MSIILASPHSPLYRDLLAFWKLDEESGNAIDYGPNGLNLTAGNDPGSAAGKVGLCRTFETASQNYFSGTSTLLRLNGTSFTIGAYVWLTTKSADRFLVTKDTAVNPNRGYSLLYRQASDRFVFGTYDGSGTTKEVSNLGGAPATGVWNFVCAWYDHEASTAGIQMNNGTVSTGTSAPSPGAQSTATFLLGFRSGAGVGTYHDGRLDAVGIWNRTLSSVERGLLYNHSRGLEPPF